MIAFAITCLLVATVFVALLVAGDSVMRGWHSYRALATELRALRSSTECMPATSARSTVRTNNGRTSRLPVPRRRCTSTGIRAAA